MKKIVAGILTFTMLSSMAIGVRAEEDIKVYVGDKQVVFDVAPIIENDRTLVPMRAIFEELGAEVTWDAQNYEVTAKKDGTTIMLAIDGAEMDKTVDGGETHIIQLDAPAKIVDDRTLVPLRAVSEAFDSEVKWDGETRTVTITLSDNGAEEEFAIAPLEGEPSDYSDKNNWINIPEITKDADTIYFYPTAYNETGDDVAPICDIDNENMREGAVEVYNKQATAFADSTNVFAPYYRQTNINYLTGKSAEEFDKIQRGVQRTDMYASLDYYFENYNNGRPFILAGHSQGAQMIKIALSEYFRAHPEYLERMVAAYPIGYSFTNEWLEENGYKFAEGADDTGVIVSWNTEGPENKGQESSVVLPGALAINPINWKRDDTYAAKEENLGSLVINDKGEQEIVPGLNDAQIDLERGVVICTTSDEFVPMPEIFGSASLHGQDYPLYYANIRENAKTRIDAYMKQK